MVTRSTGEAMRVLESKYAWEINEARAIAIELICLLGETHSRQVLEEMERRGLLDGVSNSDHWLGAVFRCRALFEFTGRYYEYESDTEVVERRGKQRNIHTGRRIKIWTLRKW